MNHLSIDPPSLVINKKTKRYIVLKDLIMLQSIGNYTLFVYKHREDFVMAHTLKYYQNILESQGFLRLHRSSLVNGQHIKLYDKLESSIVLSNGTTLKVARRKQSDMVRHLWQNALL